MFFTLLFEVFDCEIFIFNRPVHVLDRFVLNLDRPFHVFDRLFFDRDSLLKPLDLLTQ